MFTGIVEDLGVIEKITENGSNRTFHISTKLTGIGIDDSISCDGVCLTVEDIRGGVMTFTAVEETNEKTNTGLWTVGHRINLERTLKFDGRIDGHLVQGHVDGTGVCTSVRPAGGSHEITFLFDKKFNSLIIEKGSVCVNGTSLTAFQVHEDTFTVAIIPFTWSHTTFQFLKENDQVNLEFDMIGKYIQRYLSLQNK